MFPQVDTLFLMSKNRLREVSREVSEAPFLRGEDEEKREDVGGRAAGALSFLRGAVHGPKRRRRRAPRVPQVDHAQGVAVEDARGGKIIQAWSDRFRVVWAMPVADGERHRVRYVDGVWHARDLVVLIYRSDKGFVSWYAECSETSRTWSAVMGPISAWMPSPTAGRTSRAPCGAADRGREHRGASSTCSARSGSTRPQAPASGRGRALLVRWGPFVRRDPPSDRAVG